MKNYFKNISVSGVAIWILLATVVFLVIKDCSKEARHQRDLKAVMSDKDKKTSTSIEAEKIAEEANKKGDTVVIFERADPIIKTLELKIEDQRRVDSLIRINNIKEDRLQSLSTLYAEANARNLKLSKELAENGKDTVWRFQDKYLTNTIYKTDTSFRSDIWLDATVNTISYTEKKNWFFGKNRNLTKVYFNSPYVKPNGLDYLEIKQREPFFDYGLDIEGRYQDIDRNLYIGPRANIKLGRINIEGGYNWRVTGDVKGSWWTGGSYRIR